MFYSRTVLPSGIRVLSERMPEVRSVSLGFWVRVGSRDEPAELHGASHFLEHLLFKGTKTRSARAIAEAFDSVGGDANAEASKEYTVFYARVLDKDLPMALEVLSDLLTESRFSSDDFENERRVVLEELAAHEESPEDVVHDLFAGQVFGDHPLGRETLGTVSTVGGMTLESLRGFYTENYRPGSIVVAAAGSVDHSELVESIGSLFKDSSDIVTPRKAQEPAASRHRSIVTRTTEQAHLIIGGLGYSRHHPDRLAWGVLDDVLGGGSSSRLFQEVREERGLAYSVYSFRSQHGDTGFYGIYAGVAPVRAIEVLEVVGGILDTLGEDGITEAELERAKGRFRGGLALGLEDPGSRMARLGRSELVQTEILSVDELISRVDAITIDDVARVAKDVLLPESRVLTVLGPFSESDFSFWRA